MEKANDVVKEFEIAKLEAFIDMELNEEEDMLPLSDDMQYFLDTLIYNR